MKKIIYFLTLLCLQSCSSQYQFCQIGRLSSDNVILRDNNTFDYSNSDLTISYNFWSNGGKVSFTITNKSDKDIYLLTDKSYFINNGQAYDYYKNRTFITEHTTSSAKAYGYLYWAYASQSSQHYAVGTHEMKEICIPAKSHKTFSEFIISKIPYRQCGFARDSQEKDGDKLTFPTIADSPIYIENRLIFNINGEIIPITNTFYVSEFINIYNGDGYAYIADYSKDCNGNNTTYYQDVRYYKHDAPNCFYIPYDCSIGIDNDRINK